MSWLCRTWLEESDLVCFTLLKIRSWDIEQSYCMDVTASVWHLIQGPSCIMLTRANRDGGTAACWLPGWKVHSKVLFLLNMSLCKNICYFCQIQGIVIITVMLASFLKSIFDTFIKCEQNVTLSSLYTFKLGKTDDKPNLQPCAVNRAINNYPELLQKSLICID